MTKREKRRTRVLDVIFDRAAPLGVSAEGSASKADYGVNPAVRASLGPGMPWWDSNRWIVRAQVEITGARENWKPPVHLVQPLACLHAISCNERKDND